MPLPTSRISLRPDIVGNIQPLLIEYLHRNNELRETKSMPKSTREHYEQSVERSKMKIRGVLGEMLPTHRFPLIVPIPISAGARPSFPIWHSDISGLAIASSHLVTEFLVGEYQPVTISENGEAFSSRIDKLVASGDLVGVENIEPGDVIVSMNDGEHSALHRAVPNDTALDIVRILVSGSLLRP